MVTTGARDQAGDMTPSSANASRSLAARAGRWSTRHRGKAIIGWLAFVVVAFAIGNAVGTVNPKDEGGHGDSAKADQILKGAYPDRASETILIQSSAKSGVTARSPEFRAAVEDVAKGVTGKPGVREVESPYAKGNGDHISKDGHSALVSFKINGDEQLSEDRVGAVEDAVKAAAAKHPALFVGQF